MAKTVRMVTTAEHQYAGRRLHPKDEYDCEEQHVPHMQRLGWSTPKAAYETRAIDAESPDSQRTRRQYRRRDMTAQ